jgi:acyl-CoA hydrolase
VKVVTTEQLSSTLSALPGIPRVVVGGNAATPWEVVAVLDAALPEYRLWALNAWPGVPTRPGVVAETCFVGAGMRRHPELRYLPCHLSMVPVLFSTTLPPDVVIVQCTPAVDGKVSLGIEVNVLPAAIEACRARGGLVVGVVNGRMPYTFGDAELDVDQLDVAVEVDGELPSTEQGAPDDASSEVALRLAGRVPDGATLQIGIGAVPDAAIAGLAQRRDLRIWSEMFSDGVLLLDRSGALDAAQDIVSSFCFGSPELYAFADRNPRVRMLRTEVTNAPGLIAANRLMTSINTGLQVDLHGQVNASRVHDRVYSGFGGQMDFIVGAVHSAGGQAMIALRSWHPRADVSTIVPLLEEPVTSVQPSAVVTENGVAELFGQEETTQVRELIENAAHPRVRDELWEEAEHMGLVAGAPR